MIDCQFIQELVLAELTNTHLNNSMSFIGQMVSYLLKIWRSHCICVVQVDKYFVHNTS